MPYTPPATYLDDPPNETTPILATHLNTAFAELARISATVTTKTANYTITATDYVILANASGGAVTITLPTAVSGALYHVKRINSGANTVTVATTASQTIDGALTVVLSSQYAAVTVTSDGSNWFII